MNAPVVDKDLSVRTLRSGNILYDIRHRQIDSQNSRGLKPNIHPRQCSLQTNHKMTTTDISMQPQHSRDIYQWLLMLQMVQSLVGGP